MCLKAILLRLTREKDTVHRTQTATFEGRPGVFRSEITTGPTDAYTNLLRGRMAAVEEANISPEQNSKQPDAPTSAGTHR